MSFGRNRRYASSGRSSGPPRWFIFAVGLALVFGSYYLWIGAQNFIRTGGLGVAEATERADIISSATAERIQQPVGSVNLLARPTATPIPPCTDFVVDVPNAIVRDAPTTNAAIVTALFAGDPVCVIGREPGTEWYIIDQNPSTRRLETVYMHESVIRALHPTPTATRTFTPAPTTTLFPTRLPTQTATPLPTLTRDPRITNTPTPTLTPTPTAPFQNA